MALSQEKIGQIAMRALQLNLESEGISLKPKEAKRMIANHAKALGVPVHEMAEFAKIVMKSAYEKTMAEIGSINDPRVGD